MPQTAKRKTYIPEDQLQVAKQVAGAVGGGPLPYAPSEIASAMAAQIPAAPQPRGEAPTGIAEPSEPPGLPEPSLISKIMSGTGKVVASIGKGLSEPGVPEMLARMGIAFGTSPSGIPSIGAKVGQQFVEYKGVQREAAARGVTQELAGRQVGAQEISAEANVVRAEADLLRARKAGVEPIQIAALEQRFYQAQWNAIWKIEADKAPGDMRVVTDPETGISRTEWVPKNPDAVELIVRGKMEAWTAKMISKKILSEEGMYAPPIREEEAPVPGEEDLGAAVAGGAPVPSDIVGTAFERAYPRTKAAETMAREREELEEQEVAATFEEYGHLYKTQPGKPVATAGYGPPVITQEPVRPSGEGTLESPLELFIDPAGKKPDHSELLNALPSGQYVLINGVLHITTETGTQRVE